MSQICRMIDGEPVWMDKSAAVSPSRATPQVVESDALGCIAQQVTELREDARLHGFTAVEFVPDKNAALDNGRPTFYTARISDPDQFARYSEYRGQTAGHPSTGAGNIISAEHMAEASERMRQKYQR